MGFRVPVEPHFEHATRLGSRKIAPHDEHFWPSRCGFEPSFRKGTIGRGPESVTWVCSAMKIPPNDAGTFQNGQAPPSCGLRMARSFPQPSNSVNPNALNISSSNGRGARCDWTWNPPTPQGRAEVPPVRSRSWATSGARPEPQRTWVASANRALQTGELPVWCPPSEAIAVEDHPESNRMATL